MRRPFLLPLVVLVAVVATTALCAAAAPSPAHAAPAQSAAAKWTFAIYVNADNNLDDAWKRFNLPALLRGAASSDVNVVAMVDRYGNTGTTLYKFDGGTMTRVATFAEKDFGSGATFEWFLKQVSTRYPADHLLVDAWDHGYGWRGFSWDDTSYDHITMPEMRQAISGAGVNIDILSFDACNMGNVDVAYEAGKTGLVDYLVGSEETIDQDGFPYDGIVDVLAAHPDWSASQVAAGMVDAWTRYYRPLRCFTWVSLGAIDVNKVMASVPDLQAWVGSLKADLAADRARYADALDHTIYAWLSWHVDLAGVCDRLAADPAIADATLRARSATVAADVRGSMVDLWSGSYAAQFSGLTLWWGEGDWNSDKAPYRSVAFASEIGWYDFLRLWNTPASGSSTPPSRASAPRRIEASVARPTRGVPAGARRALRVARLGRSLTAWAYPHPVIERAKYGLTDVDFVDASHGWAVGYDNVSNNAIILRTTDAGAHWLNTSLPAWYAYEFGAVKALDAQHLWAVGSEGWPDSVLVASTNSGATWRDQASHTKQYLLGVDFVDAQQGWACGTGGTLLRTTDGGAHWVRQPLWTGAGDVRAVDFVSPTVGLLAGGDAQTQTGFIRRTTDGGVTWDEVMTTGGAEVYSVVAPNAGAAGYAVGGDPVSGNGIVLVSSDSITWNAASLAPTSWLSDVTVATPTTAWAVGADSTVLQSTDAGISWARQGAWAGADLTAADFDAPSDGWIVGDTEKIFHTTDGGGNWTTQIADVMPPTVRVWNASCHRGDKVALKYRVDDDMSATANVTLKVFSPSGRVVRVTKIGAKETGVQWSAIYRCRLLPGRVYTVAVWATDEAGNPQARVGIANLTVLK